MEGVKRWLVRVGQIALGAFLGSLVLENLTRWVIWLLVPRVHDVQFALLVTVISFVGGVLGAVVVLASLLVKHRRFTEAALLVALFGGLGLAFSLPPFFQARQAFDQNDQPLTDVLAYYGCTLVFCLALFCWSVLLLLFKRGRTI